MYGVTHLVALNLTFAENEADVGVVCLLLAEEVAGPTRAERSEWEAIDLTIRAPIRSGPWESQQRYTTVS